MSFNLPPGATIADINGPPMPRCEKCGREFNPEREEKVCDDCLSPDNENLQEILRAIRAGIWPTLPEIKPITTVLKKVS